MRHALVLAALSFGPGLACAGDDKGGSIEQLEDTRVAPSPDGGVETKDGSGGDAAKDTGPDTVALETTLDDTGPDSVDTTDTKPEDTAVDSVIAETVDTVDTTDTTDTTGSETTVVECAGDKCDDANPCTKDLCPATGGCGYETLLGCANDQECIGRGAGASCDDGDPATGADMCLVGWCRGFALTRIAGTEVEGREGLVVTELDDRDGTPTGWTAVVRTVDFLQRESWMLADVSDPTSPSFDGDTFQEARFAGLDDGFVGDAAGRLWSVESGAWTRENAWDAALGVSGRGVVNALFTVRGAGVGIPRGARLMWVAGGDGGEWLRACKQGAQGVLNVTCSVQVLASEDDASVPEVLAGIPECDGAGVCSEASLIVGADATLGGDFNYTEVYTSTNGLAATWSPGFVPDLPAARATRAAAAWSDANGPHFLIVGDGGYMLVRRANGSFAGPLGVKEGQTARDFSGVWVGAGIAVVSAQRQGPIGTRVYELWVAPSDGDLEVGGNWVVHELGRYPDVGSAGPYDVHGRGDGEVRVVGAVRRADDLLNRLDGAVWGAQPVSVPRELITSAQNPRVKDAAALREKKERERRQLILVEGAREIGRALSAGWRIESAFVCPELMSDARGVVAGLGRDARTTHVSAHVFDKLALREGSDGIAFVLHAKKPTLAEALTSGGAPLVVALHGIEKPGNLGAVLRTADGMGVTGVVALEGTGDPLSPNAIRASLGTVFALPVAAATTASLIEAGRERGLRFIAAALGEGARPPWQHDLTGAICIVLGAEADGLPAEWLAAADERVLIPMRGVADSLNVAAAGAMLLYEALRQRSK